MIVAPLFDQEEAHKVSHERHVPFVSKLLSVLKTSSEPKTAVSSASAGIYVSIAVGYATDVPAILLTVGRFYEYEIPVSRHFLEAHLAGR